MDRDCINSWRISIGYKIEVNEFIQFAQFNTGRNDDEVKFRYLYVNHLNERRLIAIQIKE